MFSKNVSKDMVFGIIGVLVVVVSIYLLQRNRAEGFLDSPKECQSLGRPSADKRIRVYTKGECDALGGNYNPSGECIRKTGGSFSWDCRALNVRQQGNMPAAAQTSAIPKATSGATTANPTVAQAQSKDILAAKESLKNLKLLSDVKPPLKTNLSESQRMTINQFVTEIPANNRMLDNALANRPSQPLTRITTLRSTTERLFAALKAAKATSGTLPAAAAAAAAKAAAKPTQVACGPGVITLQELRNLKFRAGEEVNRLSNLRSTSPTLKQRIDQLTKLSADLGDMITGVERDQIKLDSIPIQPDSASAFLKSLGNESIALPSLVCPPGATPPSVAASPNISVFNQFPPPVENNGSAPINPQAMQGLLEMAQYLKWNMQVKVEYDPVVAQRERVFKRIEVMEKRLLDYAISEKPLPKEVYTVLLQELQTLQALMNPKEGGSKSKSLKGSPLARFPSESARDAMADMGLAASRSPEYPTAKRLNRAQGGGFGTSKTTFPNGEISPDVYIRPGFVMNDDSIARRGSASAFDPAAVGGLDYKARAQEICRQIKSGQLGEPRDFGCIENANEVSGSYSWKGNYEMVCNRLGDSWGSWYPEMFGCPKYNPAAKFSGFMS
jgi:hypothetical protein